MAPSGTDRWGDHSQAFWVLITFSKKWPHLNTVFNWVQNRVVELYQFSSRERGSCDGYFYDMNYIILRWLGWTCFVNVAILRWLSSEYSSIHIYVVGYISLNREFFSCLCANIAIHNYNSKIFCDMYPTSKSESRSVPTDFVYKILPASKI